MAMPDVRVRDAAPSAADLAPGAPKPRSGAGGRFRWTICGLLFLATTINYVDRQVIGILKPTLQAEFGWSEIDYADIVFAFQLAYAIGFLFAGSIIDRLGIKRGFALALVIKDQDPYIAVKGILAVAGRIDHEDIWPEE